MMAKTTTPYRFFEEIFLRSPALPVTQLPSLDTATLEHFAQHHQTELYIASAQILQEVERWQAHQLNAKKTQRLLQTLYKYYTRMICRSTPFGGFSGCQLLHWGAQTELLRREGLRLHAQLDGTFAGALSRAMEKVPGLEEQLFYYTNPTCLLIGDQIRYFEYALQNERRRYDAAAVDTMPLLPELLDMARTGKSMQQLLDFLAQAGFSAAEGRPFIQELAHNKLLLTSLESPVIGPKPETLFLRHLQNIPKARLNGQFEHWQKPLEAFVQDLPQCQQLADFKAFEQLQRQLLPTYRGNGRFLVNAAIQLATPATLAETYQRPLLEALKLFNYFQAPSSSPLEAFKRQFIQRYGHGSIPLLEALDLEAGIPYGERIKPNMAPLIDDLPEAALVIGSQPSNRPQDWLLRELLLEAHKTGARQIELPQHLLEQASLNWNDLPATLYAVFRPVLEKDHNKLFVERFGGPTASRLITRFGQMLPDVLELNKKIWQEDQRLHPQVVLAELSHLPFERGANIIASPNFADWTIPVLSNPLEQEAQQIHLSDLYLTVRFGRLILFSKKLEKEVLPRFSNAFLHERSTLPFFQFLCDLQHQGKRSQLTFSLTQLDISDHFNYLPRVIYQDIILSPAIWQFDHAVFTSWQQLEDAQLLKKVEAFRAEHQLPQWVYLLDGDQELLVDWRSPLSIRTFLKEIKSQSWLKLAETFLDPNQPDGLVRDERGAPYHAQMLAFLHKEQADKPAEPSLSISELVHAIDPATPRDFDLFSAWQYYKIYLGELPAERLISEVLTPLSRQLAQAGLIEKWFFLRYKDPDFHIRWRCLCKEGQSIGAIEKALKSALEGWSGRHLIVEIQKNTYQRELERYGFEYTPHSETIFWQDSLAIGTYLKYQPQLPETVRWLYAGRSVDALLGSFQLGLQAKLALAEQAMEDFNREFRVGKTLLKSINNKYRTLQSSFERYWDCPTNEMDNLQFIGQLLDYRSAQMEGPIQAILAAQTTGDLHTPWESFLSSQVHMVLNRTFLSDPRRHEMVLYNFLRTFYQSRWKRCE